jgi:cytochrome o ubiquinol oxidase operon protein cyoD
MNAYHGTTRSYIAGFLGSLLCTLAAYALATGHFASHPLALAAVVALAVLQFAVQAVLFLHLGRSARFWNIVAFIFALVVVGIVVGGSLWIMSSLNDRMMPSMGDMMQYMQSQDSL